MPKVICKLPNASKEINGVKFALSADGMGVVSEDISEAQAELFLSIPGYEPEAESPDAAEKAAEAAAAEARKAAEKAALLKAAADKNIADKKPAKSPKPEAPKPVSEPVKDAEPAKAATNEPQPAAPTVAAGDDETIF